MPASLPPTLDPWAFLDSERTAITLALRRVEDWLLSQKGVSSTLVHYKAYPTKTQERERYGLMRFRQSHLCDRRAVMITKEPGLLVADFHIDFGELTEAEKQDPQALSKRQAQHATGLKEYSPDMLSLLSDQVRAYLLNADLPHDCIRT